jgi:hypothetical protein
MSLLVRTSTDAGALLVRDTDDPLALAVTESTSALALRVRESTSPLAMRVRGLFSPASLPGLAAWYDASDSSTVLTTVSPDVPATNGQTVRRWLSRHNPAVFWENGDLVTQPVLNNPNPGLNFNGTSQVMSGTGTMASVFRNRGYGYIFAVCQNTLADATTRTVIGFSVGGGTGMRLGAYSYNAGTSASNIAVVRRLDAGAVTASLSAGAHDTSLKLFDVRALWAAGTAFGSVNGVDSVVANLAASGNTSDTDSQSVTLGSISAAQNPYAGNIRELILVNEQLTAAQILSTRRYLQRKWGTPALP